MEERTEEQVFRGVATVIFGGEEFEIKELVARDSGRFRKRLGKVIAPFLSVLTTKPQAVWMDELIPLLFSDGMDQMVELVFEYDPTLPREEILEMASQTELIEAAGVVFDLNFPLLKTLVEVGMKMISRFRASD